MFPPYCGGGVSSHVRDLAISLARTGDEIYVFSNRRGQPISTEERAFSHFGIHTIFCDTYPQMIFGFHNLFRRYTFDIIHYHCFNTLAIDYLNKIRDHAIIFTIHSISSDFLASEYGWKRIHPVYRAMRMYEKNAIRRPDVVIAISRRLYHYATNMRANVVRYIPNSINCDFWKPLPDEYASRDAKIILIPARLTPLKGVEYAIRAMPNILKAVPDARMVIAGDGPLRIYLENLANQIKKSCSYSFVDYDISQLRATVFKTMYFSKSNCRVIGPFLFLGEIPRQHMIEIYQKSSVVLFPSITMMRVQEGISIALLEAMACEKPVIATALEGVREIISDNEQGILVPEKDCNAIADAIIKILSDRQLSYKLGKMARDKVLKEFSIPVWIKKIRNAYEMAYEIAAKRRKT